MSFPCVLFLAGNVHLTKVSLSQMNIRTVTDDNANKHETCLSQPHEASMKAKVSLLKVNLFYMTYISIFHRLAIVY